MTDQECHVDQFGRSEGGRGSAVEVLAHAVFRYELPCKAACLTSHDASYFRSLWERRVIFRRKRV
jgi:hypothetical protein